MVRLNFNIKWGPLHYVFNVDVKVTEFKLPYVTGSNHLFYYLSYDKGGKEQKGWKRMRVNQIVVARVLDSIPAEKLR